MNRWMASDFSPALRVLRVIARDCSAASAGRVACYGHYGQRTQRFQCKWGRHCCRPHSHQRVVFLLLPARRRSVFGSAWRPMSFRVPEGPRSVTGARAGIRFNRWKVCCPEPKPVPANPGSIDFPAAVRFLDGRSFRFPSAEASVSLHSRPVSPGHVSEFPHPGHQVGLRPAGAFCKQPSQVAGTVAGISISPKILWLFNPFGGEAGSLSSFSMS